VAGVSFDDVRAVIATLAEPEVLLVFSAVVVATSTARPSDDYGRPLVGTTSITTFGLTSQTRLSRDTIERAAARLVHAGLLIDTSDADRRLNSWRVNEAALSAAAG
jgi:hypothetical protein